MPGSHAEEIVVDYLEADHWALLDDADAEPEVQLPPLPPAAAGPSAA